MKNYEINKETLAIIPYGDDKSKVYEENNELIINETPMEIVNKSCYFFGSSYQGRLNGTKSMINISHKAPIIIEESRKIIFFPTMSPRLNECSWISLSNIENYFRSNNFTIIKFYCGKVLKLEISYGIIDNQVLRATRLESILDKRIKNIDNLQKIDK